MFQQQVASGHASCSSSSRQVHVAWRDDCAADVQFHKCCPVAHQLVGDFVELALDAEIDLAGSILDNEPRDEALVDLGLQLDVLAASQLLQVTVSNQSLMLRAFSSRATRVSTHEQALVLQSAEKMGSERRPAASWQSGTAAPARAGLQRSGWRPATHKRHTEPRRWHVRGLLDIQYISHQLFLINS